MDFSRHQRSWTIRIDQLIKSFGYDLCPDKPCVYRRRSGLVVVGSWYFMWKASHSLETMMGRLSPMESMDNHLVRYEELRKSQSYPWDRVRSSDKDIGLIPSCLYRHCSCQDKHASIPRKDLILLRLGRFLSSYQRRKTHAEIDKMRRIPNALA